MKKKAIDFILSNLLYSSLLVSLLFSVLSCATNPHLQSRVPNTFDPKTPLPLENPFGKNVFLFDDSMSKDAIQKKLDEVFKEQEKSEFGFSRYAFLFRPGNYAVDVNIGYYTQVLGLGENPDDVVINGHVHVEADWANGKALINFWRGAENMFVLPEDNINRWAVSQASPLRRMHFKGRLHLDDGGYSSGGYIADTRVDGTIYSGSQQQFFSRNNTIEGWENSGWNMFFIGVNGAPQSPSWPNPPFTNIEKTPLVREKPFLSYSVSKSKSQSGFFLNVPSLKKNSKGVSWDQDLNNQQTTFKKIPLEEFYIAKPEQDNSLSLNQALSDGKHLLFTPGIYHLSGPLRVEHPHTIIFGLGLATLVSDQGNTLIEIADQEGIILAGVILDAGQKKTPTLLKVGNKKRGQQKVVVPQKENPISIHDLYVRIGGVSPSEADVGVEINTPNVIGDHFWLWRADHGKGVGWDVNPAKTGLIVNGDNVIIYGLFVEHFQEYQTLWNGNNGQLYFYQSEIPYDVPSQEAWMSMSASREKKNGFASFKLGTHVNKFSGFGLGIYSFFRDNPNVVLESAIEAPENYSEISLQHMTTIFLSGHGGINHILNDRGPSVNAKQRKADLAF